MPNTREKLIQLIEEEYYCSIEEMADHLIANGATVQKWIPVSERKPQVGEWVLTYYEDKRHRVTKYDKDGFPILLTVGLEWVSVTHWMPLPVPPKGE